MNLGGNFPIDSAYPATQDKSYSLVLGAELALGVTMKKMGFFAQMAFGNALTKLTNLEEELEHSRRTMYIGAGGGIESLPKVRQQELELKFPKWIETLRSQPSHVVTRELMKNIQLNQRVGREQRIDAQIRLLKRLVDQGIAMDPDEFIKAHNRGDFAGHT